jgi:hypothetical protein
MNRGAIRMRTTVITFAMLPVLAGPGPLEATLPRNEKAERGAAGPEGSC